MYSEPSETSKLEFFVKIVDCIQPMTIFAKHAISFVSHSYEYASNRTKQSLRTVISAYLFLNSFYPHIITLP